MMRPIVLPHTAIDEFAARAELSTAQMHGPNGLRAARAQALGKGARVVLVLWESPDWQLLAIRPPAALARLGDLDVLGRLGDWPALVAEMLAKSRRGAHYTWVDLQYRPATSNAIH